MSTPQDEHLIVGRPLIRSIAARPTWAAGTLMLDFYSCAAILIVSCLRSSEFSRRGWQRWHGREDGVSESAPKKIIIPRSALDVHKSCVIFGKRWVGLAGSGGSNAGGLGAELARSCERLRENNHSSVPASEAPANSRRLLSPHSRLVMLDIWPVTKWISSLRY